MKAIFIAVGLLTVLGTACVSVKRSNQDVQVTMIRKGPNQALLDIAMPEWGGHWGPQGLVGYQTVTYRAALAGVGPSYPNPPFKDYPSHYECVGTITIDRIHNRVEISLNRVVSKPGEDWRIEPHPANGTYTIDVSRDATAEERWFE